MGPVAVLLAATFVAAGPQPSGERVAALVVPRDALLGAIPADHFSDVLLQALPPPPTIIVRETRYYGTVTIDHRVHLARRASCKSCHGPGPVSKLVYTPKVAHARCIGCHQERAKGPTACQGCHVKTAPKPAQLVAAAPALAPPPAPPPPNPKNVAAALAAFDAPRAGAHGAATDEPFHRALEVGVAVGRGQGVSVRLASHQDFVVFTQSVERMTSATGARTLGLVGAGITRSIERGVCIEGLALGGFDVIERPVVALLPAIGARAGIVWRPRFGFLHRVTASVTGVVDLSTRSTTGGEVGGVTVYGTLATGFSIPLR